VANYSIILGPYFTSGYITDDYVLDGSLAAVASVSATSETLTLKEAQATITSQFTLSQQAGLLIEVNEVIPYTWDDVYGTWDSWPGAHWEYRGLRINAVDQVSLETLNTIFQGVTALTAQFSVSVTGTHMRYGEASLSTTASLDTTGQVTYSGVTAVNSQFSLTTTGLRIQEIASSLFDNCTLDTYATVIWSGETAVNSAFSTQTTSYMLWSAVPEQIRFETTADFDSNLKINNGDQTFRFPMVFTLAQAITLAKNDPHRFLLVTPENRTIVVLAEPRQLEIPVNTRLAQILTETRALEVEQANRVLKLNIPPFKELVNERQI